MAAGTVGALLSYWATALLNKSISYMELARMHSFRVDLSVLGFTAAISLLATVLFGLGPAIRWSKFEVNDCKTWRRPICIAVASPFFGSFPDV